MTDSTTADELARLNETPGIALPREQLLMAAMAARSISGVLREAREKAGRASWSDGDEAARIELAVDSASIDRLSRPQAEEWNARVAAGEVSLQRSAGMTISNSALSDGTHVVQATLDDRTVTVAAGSAATAHHVKDWLAGNPSHESLSDLRAVSRETSDIRSAAASFSQTPDAVATEAGSELATESTALRDRLRSVVDEQHLNRPGWQIAEDTYSDLVDRGADADELVAAVAAINFKKARSPGALGAFVMRKTAAGQVAPNDEEQARREAAAEWLAGASDSPTDRARAAQVVGKLGTDFDRSLAEKFPGILTPDPETRWHDHNNRSMTDSDLATQYEERANDEQLSVILGPHGGEDDRSLADDHAAASDGERDLRSGAESDRLQNAASHNDVERAAAAPLSKNNQGTAPQNRQNTTTQKPATRSAALDRTRTRSRTL